MRSCTPICGPDMIWCGVSFKCSSPFCVHQTRTFSQSQIHTILKQGRVICDRKYFSQSNLLICLFPFEYCFGVAELSNVSWHRSLITCWIISHSYSYQPLSTSNSRWISNVSLWVGFDFKQVEIGKEGFIVSTVYVWTFQCDWFMLSLTLKVLQANVTLSAPPSSSLGWPWEW